MAASRTSALVSEGALYEAVARGNKDTFFFRSDKEALTDPSVVNPFETRYERSPPFVQELRRIPPTNGADFGRAAEWEFEVAGDLFTQPTIVIDLPTWLPSAVATLNPTATVRFGAATGPSSYAIGYTSAIGYFIFEKIQLYQDKFLLYEFSGDALWASRLSRGSLATAYVENALVGAHGHTASEVARNATPGRLRLALPFIGPASSLFPSIAMRKQSFKLRVLLRKLEELVEASDGREAPKPWAAGPMYVTPFGSTPGGIDTYQAQAKQRTQMDQPTLQLETRHYYTDEDSRAGLVGAVHELPFSVLYENRFTFGPLDYAPLRRQAVAASTQRVDAQHPAGRLFWLFRSQNDLRANRRWAIQPPDASGGPPPSYYNAMGLIIAGRDREAAAAPLLWERIVPHAKEEREAAAGWGVMNWTLGDVQGRRLGPGQDPVPEGTINFTTADRPTMYIELNSVPPDTILKQPSTEMLAIVDTWALYTIEKDRGTLKYAN